MPCSICLSTKDAGLFQCRMPPVAVLIQSLKIGWHVSIDAYKRAKTWGISVS